MQKAFEESSTSWCNYKPLRRREEDDEAVMKTRAFHDWKDGWTVVFEEIIAMMQKRNAGVGRHL
ncbi:hypothetical protein IGI04_037068 [Brassica rapa subsp. trilocularis]|uniref:Uncharacterized protein n=1 Tax=Brassica rapa subsp. trilocularis TaxID=1813537 RepID=A0ABQ7LGA9_BRACM|nr:hypothetical protein IGI04_037068 [Brassica rapa subsp. trilocularis]